MTYNKYNTYNMLDPNSISDSFSVFLYQGNALDDKSPPVEGNKHYLNSAAEFLDLIFDHFHVCGDFVELKGILCKKGFVDILC